MILTEKGSTRGTVSFLLLSTIVLLIARILVGIMEDMLPHVVPTAIHWQPIADVVKDDDEDAFDVKKEGQSHSEDSPFSSHSGRLALDKLLCNNKKHLPVLMFFTDSSPLCKNMEARSLSPEEVSKLADENFYPVRIATENALSKTEYKIWQKYGIVGVPQIIITTFEGERISSGFGYLSAAKVRMILHSALKTLRASAEKKQKQGEKKQNQGAAHD